MVGEEAGGRHQVVQLSGRVLVLGRYPSLALKMIERQRGKTTPGESIRIPASHLLFHPGERPVTTIAG
ncbi:MAG: hypothetical protein R2704_09250 [Microthrixaceae bacterium]